MCVLGLGYYANLCLLLVTNITNIVLDIYFVVYLDWAVSGAAWASLIADYTALAFALILVVKLAKKLFLLCIYDCIPLHKKKNQKNIFFRFLKSLIGHK